LEPRRRRGGLVAAAVVVALLAAGVAVGILSRTAAPTVTTGDDTPTATVPVLSGCRLVDDCPLPPSPRQLDVHHLPERFVRFDRADLSANGQPGAVLGVPPGSLGEGSSAAAIALQVVRRAGVNLDPDPMRAQPVPTTIGGRRATLFPAEGTNAYGTNSGSSAGTNTLWVDLTDDLLLSARGTGVSDNELRAVVESVAVR
jgi:hypothetical protein